MVNIGILGDVSVGKTTILRLFVRFIEQKLINEKFDVDSAQIVKTDFSGEATLPSKTATKQTKTIHPNRVVFRLGDKMHTLFAPGGDNRPLVRMGIVTVSRIARVIIAVFDLSRELDDQFAFYDKIRFIPKTIYVALNKADLVKDLNKKVDDYKKKIVDYFKTKRNIKVNDVYITVAEAIDGFQDQNDECAKMIINLVSSS
ncbi:MAG: GTPase domain-containing protein [Promethearchaeota archaeon]